MASAVFLFMLVLVLTSSCENAEISERGPFNLENFLNNNNILNNIMDCLLDKGPCFGPTEILKKIIPDGIQTGCQDCSDAQKEHIRMVLNFLHKKNPEQWNKLLEKYDSDGKYREMYKDYLN